MSAASAMAATSTSPALKPLWPCCSLARREKAHGVMTWACPLHGDEIMGRKSPEKELTYLKMVLESLSQQAIHMWLDEQASSRWTDVKEHLPPKGLIVLVVVEDSHHGAAVNMARHVEGVWMLANSTKLANVTHWALPPQLPTKKKKN